MRICVNGRAYRENETLDIVFGDETRSVSAFDLVLARRAIQDAIVARIQPDTDEDALNRVVYTPLFEERVAIKFDPDGLAFFIYPLQKDSSGAYADTRYSVPLEYVDDDEDDCYDNEPQI